MEWARKTRKAIREFVDVLGDGLGGGFPGERSSSRTTSSEPLNPPHPVGGPQRPSPAEGQSGTLPDGTEWMVSRSGRKLAGANIVASSGGVTASVRSSSGYLLGVQALNGSVRIETSDGTWLVNSDGARRVV